MKAKATAAATTTVATDSNLGEFAPGAARTKVFSIMSHGARTVPIDFSTEALAQLFVEEGLNRVLVVDAAGAPRGVVSQSDLVLRQYLKGDTLEVDAPRSQLKNGVTAPLGAGFGIEAPKETIGEVMSTNVVSVGDEMTIVEACDVMARAHTHGVPVMSASRGAVGWLSAIDVVAWVARRGH